MKKTYETAFKVILFFILCAFIWFITMVDVHGPLAEFAQGRIAWSYIDGIITGALVLFAISAIANARDKK